MLLKWKSILTNWINCYCNDRDSKDLDINIDSLLIIISQLRKNLSLDDSRSSLLEAHNIQEFTLEKYPDFKFENGTSEPTTEEDLYLSASLLLFFVCVNSKNIDLKNAMCSKLSASDQEIILKFSKCLMGCTSITSSDVQQAITEACGLEMAGVETVSTNTVAETPPALRSLHSEVRRLQAALDAERFDRNYLQEELSRTNLKLEKLSKLKEQYKLEIVSLKAKVPDGVGVENCTAENEASHNNSVKLAKQLEQAEERLANLQEELSNAEYERNSYKNKLDELKRDRDKYLALSQQENSRASQLAEELDIERRQCVSLRELVTELRQHNRLNRMDSSQLECDDLDASVHSLQHNSSVCSEVCANIIEVQLAEERTKITTLKTQMQMLQDQLTDLNNKYENEKMDFSKTLSEKDSHIMNLKHRINEEIESRNVMKSQYDNDITKLNNEINELEQTLKDTTENTRKIMDTKMQEIQTLQEEKLSLLQSFSNETSKLQTKIQDLKKEIETEKTSKQKLREDCDNHIMKLNEKVLNRNNELVELQNKIVTKGEEVENLQLQLRNEKDMRQELINKHNNDVLHYNKVIKEQNYNAQKSSDEKADLQKQVQQYCQCIEEMNKERNNLNTSLLSLKEEVKKLTGDQQIWLKNKEELQHDLDEKIETINSLKSQLQTEIQFKNETQSTLTQTAADKQLLSHEKTHLKNKLSLVTEEKTDACNKLKDLDETLTQEKEKSQSLQKELDISTKNIKELSELIEEKENGIKQLQEQVASLELNNEKLLNEFESERLILKNMVSVTESVMEDQKVSYTNEIEECTKAKESLHKEINQLQVTIETEKQSLENSKIELEKVKEEKEILENSLIELQDNIQERTTKINCLIEENSNLNKTVQENSEMIIKLKDKIKELIEDKIKLTENIDTLKQEFTVKVEKLETERFNLEESNAKLLEDIRQVTLCKEELLSERNKIYATFERNNESLNKLEEKAKKFMEFNERQAYSFNSEKQKLLTKIDTLEKENQQCKESLQKQILELEEVIENEKQLKQNEIAKKDNEVEITLAKLNNLKEEKQNIEDNLRKFHNDLAEKTLLTDILKSEKEEYLVQIKILSEEKICLEKDLSQKTQIEETLQKQIKDLEETNAILNNLKEEKQNIEDNLYKLHNVLAEKTSLTDMLKSEKEEHLGRIERLSKEKICLEKDLSEKKLFEETLQKQIKDLEVVVKTEKQEAVTAVEKKVEEIQATVSELHRLKMENLNIEENMSRLQEDMIQKTSYIETLKTENTELAAALKLNKEAMLLLEEEIKSVSVNKNKLASDFETEKQELENIISETQSALEKQVEILNNKGKEESQSKETLQEQLQSLQNMITQEREKAECTLNEKEARWQNTIKELNMIKEERMALGEKVSSLERELLDKVAQLDVISNEKADLEKSSDEKLNAIQVLQQELVTAKQEHENFLTASEIEKDDLRNKIVAIESAFKEERLQTNKSNSEYFNANEMLQNEVATLQKEKNSVEMKVNELEAAYKAKEYEINCVKKEKDTLHENITKLNQDLGEKESMIIENNSCIENLQKKCSDLENQQSALKDSVCSEMQKVVDNLVKEEINSDIIKKLDAVKNTEDLSHTFDGIVKAVTALTKELSVRKSLEMALKQENTAVEKLTSLVEQKEVTVNELQDKLVEVQKLHQTSKHEFSKQAEQYKEIIDAKTKEVDNLVLQNSTLHNELNDVKIQLDTKIHSLQDKLVDNEHITDKLKATYESQIDSLNVMVSKLTSYLKEKTIEMEAMSKEKSQLVEALNESNSSITLLEEELRSQKQKHEQVVNEFESERVVLKNMVSATEAVSEDQKLSLSNKVTELSEQNDALKERINKLEEEIIIERKNAEMILNEKAEILNMALKDLSETKDDKKTLEKELLEQKEIVATKTKDLESILVERNSLCEVLETVQNEKTLYENKVQELQAEIEEQLTSNNDLLKQKENEIINLKEELKISSENIKEVECLRDTISQERDEIVNQLKEKEVLLETEQNLRLSQLDELQRLQQLQTENLLLQNTVKEKELEIMAIKEHIKNEENVMQQVSDQDKMERTHLEKKCEILEEYQMKAEEELKNRQSEIEVLVSEMESIRNMYAKVELEKNTLIEKLETELKETKSSCLHYKKEAEKVNIENNELRDNLNMVNTNTVYNLKKENELLLKAVTNRENMAANDKENIAPNYRDDVAMKIRDLQNQVHDSAFDNTTSSVDSSKTITDLEKIIQDKNRTITTLHSDVTYLKTLIAESENKLLDVTKDLDLSRENCHQLSNQLKKVVYQKNEEIAELKNKVTKMSATETRATQIIKVSAKYQAMILKRVAEIKNNTVLKELTNFGNSANGNGENELRRSFNAGNITMEDLENFLETTDRHLKRCSEKQVALQKERDRLLEINKINDSEIIAMRKFLTELSVSVKTFNSVKELYSQKLNRVIAVQRTVRREILNLDGRINDATMCKLERGYAAIMQDLSECALNLERWVDRSIVRSISPEKIKQAFMSELDRASLVPTNFQNTSLEVQFAELEASFQRLLKEVMQAAAGDGAKDAQALTLLEVRAEYEDKLSRMKAKMKELYVDQISQFQEKQRKEIEEYERRLQKANDELQKSSGEYQEHIRRLTAELWSVGEKFIMQKDEAQWLRKQHKSGSLMSLQHVHSTGLLAPHEPAGRPSDTHSLRSLPAHNNERRGRKTCNDMSDEEGEVFDNRCLRELSETPRRARPSVGPAAGAGARLSELQRRNTLCRPHLKSSYPAETQFVAGVQEDDIKCNGSMSLGGRARKEVGITAYKKPGPPTPSKQAGRLSATDSELRESLRVEAEPSARRTATPSRLMSLFRGKHDTVEGTPRTRRLSNIFRKK